MYYVIHSKDPYLLARFCTELQMEGYVYPEYWAEEGHHPFFTMADLIYSWLTVDPDDKEVRAHNHSCSITTYTTRFTLTSRNYTEVLEAVLTNKTK